MRVNEFLSKSNYINADCINKEVKIVCTDGEIIFGRIFNYVSALDNEPDGEAIDIWPTRHPDMNEGPTEIETAEIADIELTQEADNG